MYDTATVRIPTWAVSYIATRTKINYIRMDELDKGQTV
jgi:hypothetical protein